MFVTCGDDANRPGPTANELNTDDEEIAVRRLHHGGRGLKFASHGDATSTVGGAGVLTIVVDAPLLFDLRRTRYTVG